MLELQVFVSFMVSCLCLSALIKEYFVPIFVVSMVVNCSKKPSKESAGRALCESLPKIGDISETERDDDLIKRHLVCTSFFPLKTLFFVMLSFHFRLK